MADQEKGACRPIRKMARSLVKKLAKYDPVIRSCENSSSYYIRLTGCEKCTMIRVSDHIGHKLRKRQFDLRSDNATYSRYRIYNFRDVNKLISRITENE